MKLLLSSGAAVDQVDNSGQTTLILAIKNGHLQIVEVRLVLETSFTCYTSPALEIYWVLYC